MPVGLVSMTEEQIAETGATPQEIPAGTYAGIDEPVMTTSLPVTAYTTTGMDDDTAYTDEDVLGTTRGHGRELALVAQRVALDARQHAG